jgi:hypothetical protein
VHRAKPTAPCAKTTCAWDTLARHNYKGFASQAKAVIAAPANWHLPFAGWTLCTATANNRRMVRIVFCFVLTLAATTLAAEPPPFAQRGYYMTFMRMPVFGLPQWKQMVDCLVEDDGNMLMLWTAGGFRSRKFPETWEYNRDHKNVEQDFVRDLIDYAHTKNVKVLLCFTPYAYDGVNQYSIRRPELRATGKDGKETSFWGMHSWGYNLCPSKPESQRFMLEYVREMFFDFYPNADGLMIESSDYAICHCPECRKQFFVREFELVKDLSASVWKAKPAATITVYPHYFTGSKVPGYDVRAATEKFDPRWTLFFTPHSAHIDSALMKQARAGIYSNEGLSLGTPATIRESIRVANRHGLTGYVPSLEPFTCPAGPPDKPGPRVEPFNFGWLTEGEMPLNELPMRVNRIAYREYCKNPGLAEEEFRRLLSQAVFGAEKTTATDDLLFLNASCFRESGWFKPPPLLAGLKNQQADKQQQLRDHLERVKAIAARYEKSTNRAERELHKIASWIAAQWN